MRPSAIRSQKAAIPGLKDLSLPKLLCETGVTFSACGAGGRVKPGVERDSAQPQGYGATNPIKPANAGGSSLSFAPS
jgi:hypothetical protein